MKKSILAALLTGALCTTLGVPATAQTSSLAASYCGVNVRAYATNDPNQLAFGVWSDDVAGTATGNVTAYVNGSRYQIPFTNVIAPDERDRAGAPQLIAVDFGAPAHFESAYVGSLAGGECAVHEPFVQKPLKTALTAVTSIDAPAPVREDALACAVPYAPASTRTAVDPVHPDSAVFFSGNVNVKLALAADGKVMAMRVDKAGKQIEPYVHAAAFAAAESMYSPEIYRCEPVSTTYNVAVNFSPYTGDHPVAPMPPAPLIQSLTGYSNGPASATGFR